jgi:integrase
LSAKEPIRDAAAVQRFADYFTGRGNYRDYLLLVVGINTALRISDMLRLRWRDVYNFELSEVKSSLRLTEKKTGKHKIIALNSSVRHALAFVIANTGNIGPSSPLFPRTWDRSSPISRIRAYMIIREAGNCFGMDISCHSLRKSFGYHAWKNDAPLPIIMSVYNHSSFSVTMRYLGINQDDINALYEDMAKYIHVDSRRAATPGSACSAISKPAAIMKRNWHRFAEEIAFGKRSGYVRFPDLPDLLVNVISLLYFLLLKSLKKNTFLLD